MTRQRLYRSGRGYIQIYDQAEVILQNITSGRGYIWQRQPIDRTPGTPGSDKNIFHFKKQLMKHILRLHQHCSVDKIVQNWPIKVGRLDKYVNWNGEKYVAQIYSSAHPLPSL